MPRRATSEQSPVDPVISMAAFLRQAALAGNLKLRTGRTVVDVTNLDRLYWPADGYTKGDLLRYYVSVGKTILPYLKDRPTILKRYPNGAGAPMFFQHNVENAPGLLKTIELESEAGRAINYAVYSNLASLIYLVNIGTIEQHPWHSRIGDLDHPDYIVFDLDPHGAPFAHVRQVALVLREVLKALRLTGYPKTSGSAGIHIYVPVRRRYGYEEIARFAEQVSERVAERAPGIATVERRLTERKKDQVYVDWQQNARGKAAAAVYTVRARPGASVSTPVTWQEIARGFEIDDFTIKTVPPRLAKKGDLWRDMLKDRQRLPKLAREI
jgi:bifunctional non-homologous end joining protein LigD